MRSSVHGFLRPFRRCVPAVALLLVPLACDAPTPPGSGTVLQVAISLPSPTLRPGRSMVASAAALGVNGDVLNVPVLWTSLTPTLLAVGSNGELLGLRPGTAVLRATAGAVSSQVEIALVNPAAQIIEFVTDTLRLSVPGGPTAVAARALDAGRGELVGALLSWSIEDTRIATVDAAGFVTPRAVGMATLVVSIDGISARRPIQVGATVTATSPHIDSISVATIVPGVPFTLFGPRFAATVSGNEVLVDGLAATVTAVVAGRITAVLPSGAKVCLPTRRVQVQLRTTGGIGAAPVRLRIAPQRTLAIGEAALLTSADAASCVELTEGEGRYLVTLQNGGRALGVGPITVRLDAVTGGDGPTSLLAAGSLRIGGPAAAAGQGWDAHAWVLDGARRAAAAAPPPTALPQAEIQLPAVNGVVPMRVPDLEAPNPCTGFTPIGARLVWGGERIAVLEDTLSQQDGAPTMAGRMDAELVALGQEADAVLFPLAQRFGNPLVMDSRLDANGKIVLVVTPRMNSLLGGAVLGAVATCDFFTRAQFAASNVGEIIYLQAATSTAAGFGEGTRQRWAWEIRGTVAHELKHVSSYAERIVRGQPLEEPWLDEAMARHAEELFLQVRTGTGPDAGYAAMACELGALRGSAGCDGTPRAMLPHFEGLWDFFGDPVTHSPLGPRDAGDRSFYGSAWALTRWAMDHAPVDAATFARDLTRSGDLGVANLEARAGRSWDEMLGRWSLAMLTETRGTALPLPATLTMPSWNLADVFAGLCRASGSCAGGSGRFTEPDPLRPLTLGAGDVRVTVGNLVPGGFAALELMPEAPRATRLLKLTGAGGAISASTRLAILRIE